MKINLSDTSLDSLNRRIAENTARGWSLVGDVRSNKYDKKDYYYRESRGNNYNFAGTNRYEKYFASMRKED